MCTKYLMNAMTVLYFQETLWLKWMHLSFILQCTCLQCVNTGSYALVFQYIYTHACGFCWLPCEKFQYCCWNYCFCCLMDCPKLSIILAFLSLFPFFKLNCMINMTLPCLTFYTFPILHLFL